MKITGTIGSGSGRVAEMPQDIFDQRSEECGVRLLPGTLNVHPENPREVQTELDEIPGGMFSEATPEFLGKLRFWNAILRSERFDGDEECVLVRHEKSNTKYFEIMGTKHFRNDLGIEDGDAVEIEVHGA